MPSLSPAEWAWFWVLAAPSLGVLGMVLLNLAVWPRGRARGRIPGRVSVCIPARNEGRSIVACVRAALSGTQRPDEVLVYDDASTDGTAEVLERLCEAERSLRVVRGGELPPGWLGKPWACHRLSQEATGDFLVFLDADTVPTPTCLARIGYVVEQWGADLMTANPRQLTGTLTEQMVIPLLELRYLAWLPVPFVWRIRHPRVRVGNGQLVVARRDALMRANGWEAASAAVADGDALARRFKEIGAKVVYAQGQNLATGRMFDNRAELWRGLSKTFYFQLVRRPLILVMALALYGALFAPYVGLWQAFNGYGVLLWPSVIGVGANVALRAAMAIRLRQSSNGILLHPIGLLWLGAIALNSFRLSRRGTLDWRGRRYELGGMRSEG